MFYKLNASAKGILGLCYALAFWVLLRPTKVLNHSIKHNDPKNIKANIKKPKNPINKATQNITELMPFISRFGECRCDVIACCNQSMNVRNISGKHQRKMWFVYAKLQCLNGMHN